MSMILWPAVIRFEGDDELCYVDSERTWRRDAASLLYNHHGHDQLIDSNGRLHNIGRQQGDLIETVDSGEHIALNDFIKQVRIHASCAHRCCIEKINFRSIAEGIRLIDSLNQT